MTLSKFAASFGVVSVLSLAMPALAQKSNDTLRTARVDQFTALDRYNDPGNHTVFTTSTLYDGLISYDFATQKFLPSLAKSWKRIDPTTLEFELRDDITWSDGQKFTADDIVYTINWVTDPKSKLRIARSFTWMSGVEKVSSTAVRIREKGPTRYDMMILAETTPIMPKHAHEGLENKSDFSKKAVGTGPFKLTEFNPNAVIRFERNNAYKHANAFKTAGKVGKIDVRLIADYGAQTAEMLAGNLDVMGPVPLDTAQAFMGRTDYRVEAHSSFSYNYLMINVFGDSGVPALKDKRVRQAISMAINPNDLYTVLGGDMKVDWPEHMCWTGTRHQVGCEFTKKPPTFDPAGAKKLLAEAGYPNGFAVDIYTIQGLFRQAAVALAGNLRAVGIQADVKALARPAYNTQIRDNKFPLILRGWSGGVIPDVADTMAYFLTGEHAGYISTADLEKRVSLSNDEPDVKKFTDQARAIFDEITEDHRIRMLTPIPDIFVLSSNTTMQSAPVAGSVTSWGLSWK
jgi:peptide/nickel transport system substrate-binding protein